MWHCTIIYEVDTCARANRLPSPFCSVSPPNLSLLLERLWKSPHVILNRALVPQELHVRPVDLEFTFGAFLEVLFAAQRREAPVLGDDDLLTARELVLRAAQSFDCCCSVYGVGLPLLVIISVNHKGTAEVEYRHTGVTGPNGEQDLADVHTSYTAVGFAPCSTHSSLQPISAGT